MSANPNPLANLPAAEAGLVAAIHAATNTLNDTCAGTVAAALTRLDAAADSCRARITAAMMRLNAITAGVLNTLEAAASGIFAVLDVQPDTAAIGTASEPAADRGRALPAPTSSATSTASTPASEPEPNAAGVDDDGITLTAADGKGMALFSTGAHADALPPRQGTQGPEAAREPSHAAIETPRANCAAGETVLVAAIAANPPVDVPDRDNRKRAPTAPAPKRRRRKAG